MKTSLICLIINLACGAIFSAPTVAFLSEVDVFESDRVVVEDRSIAVSEPQEAMSVAEKMDVLRALVEPVESLTEPVEGIVEGSEGVGTVTEVVEPEFEHLKPKRHYGYFDVPLEEELQDHIFALCEDARIDPKLVMAIIQKESTFDAEAIGDRGRAQGLMQVQERWHFDRIEELGVTDLLDPYQNVTVGIHFLEELIWLGGGSIEWALMAYNGGHGLANERAESVVEYAEIVMSWAEEMR